MCNCQHKRTGFYVETYGGDRYDSIAWYLTREAAESEVKRIVLLGAWHGKRPRVTDAKHLGR